MKPCLALSRVSAEGIVDVSEIISASVVSDFYVNE
jgi:hypothetical protein